ncbi:MAG: ATP-binding cassette domain-containing protein [Ichthyobacteriaceae bacterium]|nr:ATP-binding cassette domain-containing protein [Ichthyobacteriaceae bacterium]
MNLLEAKNITKKYYKHTALNNVSFNIQKGSIYGLLGPNGAGKTTFIRIINQIIAQDSGTIIFNGEKLQSKHISEIGYMPEERGLYRNMKVGEQVLYLAQLKGMPYNIAKQKLKYWFDKFEISSWWDKKIEELSKGMAQKVQFIVTVLHEPKLLIFDEPFSGFDPVNAQIIKNEIIELKNNGATILFSTHRMESVEEMCDHIGMMNKSEKILDGEIGDVKRQHRTNNYNVTINKGDVGNILFENNISKIIETKPNVYFKDQIDVTIKMHPNGTSQQLIKELMSIGELHHFQENIPSINDIFIQHAV